MASDALLTSDDLDEIGHEALSGGDPSAAAAELVEGVEQGRLSDPADTAYALTLAADLTARCGDLDAALTLTARAIEANRIHGDPEYGYARPFHAELLMKLGRDGEALAELAALRPLLTKDSSAAEYVGDALQGGGYTDIAVQWLTTALEEALGQGSGSESSRPDPAHSPAPIVVFSLARHRHGLRRDLNLPHDTYDDLADRLQAAVTDTLSEDEDDDTGVLFWPQEEFERLVLRWPRLAERYGTTWDEHRAGVERELTSLSEAGHPSLTLLAGSVDELTRHADRLDSDPTEPKIQQTYLTYREMQGDATSWPPGRNHPCWCLSGVKYKKCSRSRSRS